MVKRIEIKNQQRITFGNSMSLTDEIRHVGGGDFLPYIPVHDFIAVMIWCQEVLDDPLHVHNRVGKDPDDMGH